MKDLIPFKNNIVRYDGFGTTVFFDRKWELYMDYYETRVLPPQHIEMIKEEPRDGVTLVSFYTRRNGNVAYSLRKLNLSSVSVDIEAIIKVLMLFFQSEEALIEASDTLGAIYKDLNVFIPVVPLEIIQTFTAPNFGLYGSYRAAKSSNCDMIVYNNNSMNEEEVKYGRLPKLFVVKGKKETFLLFYYSNDPKVGHVAKILEGVIDNPIDMAKALYTFEIGRTPYIIGGRR